MTETDSLQFLIAPATLTFCEVTDLKLYIDYAVATAAMTPFSIDGIERTVEQRAGYAAVHWRIPINWPAGEIRFDASGFTQRLRSHPILSDRQYLTLAERGAAQT